MKSMIIGLGALVIGLGGGAFASGSKVKDELLLAHADSIAQAETSGTDDAASHAAATNGSGSEGVPVELSPPPQNDPAAHTAGVADAGGSQAATDDVSGMAPSLPVGTTVGATSTPAVEPGPAEPTEAERAAAQAVVDEAAEEQAAALAMAEGAQKLSKIFGAMKAPDAAAVLQQMTDEEVKAILLQMSDRLAAAILGEFDAERAAELTRVVLMSRGGDA